MNDRIRQLAQQAEKYADDNFRGEPTYSEAYDSKFAELIIEECARRCDVVRENAGGDRQFGARLCADEIRWMNRRS